MSVLQFDIGLVVTSSYEEGFLGVQVDLHANGARSEHAEAHYPAGTYARPLDPALDADGDPKAASACQVLYAWEGGQLHTWPVGDPRYIPLLPELTGGGHAVFGGQPNAAQFGYAHFQGEDGGYRLIVPSAATATFTVGSTSLALAAASAKLHSALVELGSGAAQPIVMAQQLDTYLAALEAVIITLAGIVDAKIVPSTPPAAAPITAALNLLTPLRLAYRTTLVKAI